MLEKFCLITFSETNAVFVNYGYIWTILSLYGSGFITE